MAYIQIEEVVDYLNSEMRKALEQAVQCTLPNAQFYSDRLFREFRRAVGRNCSTWVEVPDQFVEK